MVQRRPRHRPIRTAATRAAAPAAARGRAWMLWAGVFGLALAVRLIVLSQLDASPLFQTPQLDAEEYVTWARRILAGREDLSRIVAHGPGYPWFLAAMLALFADSLGAARVVQAILGSLAAVLTASTATRLFDRRAGMAAGVLHACYGPLALADISLLAEVLLVVCLLAALWATTRSERPGWRAWSGLMLGLATITRPTAVLALPAVLLHAPTRRAWRQRGMAAAACLAGWLLVVVPVVSWNWARTGAPVVQAFGGLNVFIGNSPSRDGLPSVRLGAGWRLLDNEARRAGILDPVGQDRYYVTKTLDEIGRQPLAYARLLASKLAWTFQAEEIRDTHSYRFWTEQSPVLRFLPRFDLVAALAALGTLVALGRRALPSILVLYVGAMAATCVFLVVGSRYRLPVVPGLIILAGPGLLALLDGIRALVAPPPAEEPAARRRRLRELAVLLLVLVTAFGATHVRRHAASRNLAEEWAFTGRALEGAGRLDEAETALRRALAADPRSGFSWDRLGVVLAKTGRAGEARAAFEAAIAQDGANTDALYHLGLLEEQQNRPFEAAARIREALRVAPDDIFHRGALARVLVSSGQLEEAETVYRALARDVPNDSSFHVGLGFVLNARRAFDAALTEARRAVVLDANNDRAWLLMAQIGFDTGNVALIREGQAGVDRLLGPASAESRAIRDRLGSQTTPAR